MEDIKRAIINFCSYTYHDKEYSYEKFHDLFPDEEHICMASKIDTTNQSQIHYEIDLKNLTATQYINDTVTYRDDFLKLSNRDYKKATEIMLNNIKNLDKDICLTVYEKHLNPEINPINEIEKEAKLTRYDLEYEM